MPAPDLRSLGELRRRLFNIPLAAFDGCQDMATATGLAGSDAGSREVLSHVDQREAFLGAPVVFGVSDL